MPPLGGADLIASAGSLGPALAYTQKRGRLTWVVRGSVKLCVPGVSAPSRDFRSAWHTVDRDQETAHRCDHRK